MCLRVQCWLMPAFTLHCVLKWRQIIFPMLYLVCFCVCIPCYVQATVFWMGELEFLGSAIVTVLWNFHRIFGGVLVSVCMPVSVEIPCFSWHFKGLKTLVPHPESVKSGESCCNSGLKTSTSWYQGAGHYCTQTNYVLLFFLPLHLKDYRHCSLGYIFWDRRGEWRPLTPSLNPQPLSP